MGMGTRYNRAVNRFSATGLGSWLVKHVAARLDPLIFRATGGRFTITGPPTLPMLTLTTIGRQSGRPRSVQLAYVAGEGGYLVVASAMGQQRHPGWRYNLEAAGQASVVLRGRTEHVTAEVLTDDEKSEWWDQIVAEIPQMHTYTERTDRNIRVFRLTPIAEM